MKALAISASFAIITLVSQAAQEPVLVHCQAKQNPLFKSLTASLNIDASNQVTGTLNFTGGGEKLTLQVEGSYFAGVYMAPARFELNPSERNSIFGEILLIDGDAPNGSVVVNGAAQRLVCRPFE